MNQNQEKEQQILQNIANILCEEKKHFVVTDLKAGSGSFGKCMFVENQQDKSKYAIKSQIIIDPHLQQIDDDKLKNCQNEAQILREIKHKNVVKVYDDYQIKNYHFIEMEQCEGSLQKWVESQKNQEISQMQFMYFANQLLDGVEYIHSLNYVLRDLSLGNILICSDGTLKICDFGLAKKYKPDLEEQMLLTKTFKGAAFYYPPEIINSKDEQYLYSQKGDIWAIGVCLQMIGGLDFPMSYLVSKKVNSAPKLDDKCNNLLQFILNEDKQQRPTIPMIRKFIYDNIIKEQFFYGFLHLLSNLFQKRNKEVPKSNVNQIIDYIQRYEKSIEFDYENVKEIENNCTQRILENPENLVDLIILGEIYLNYYKEFQKSELFFKKALQINQNDIDALLGLAQVENLKNFLKYNNSSQNIDIQNILSMCSQLSQNQYWRVSLVSSIINYYQRDFQESYKQANQCYKLNPSNSLANLLKQTSLAYQSFGYEIIKKALTNNLNILNQDISYKNHYFGYYLIASLYRQIQQNDKAIQYYLKCNKYTKNDLQIWAYLSILYNKTNQIELSKYYQNEIVNLNNNFTKELERMNKYF